MSGGGFVIAVLGAECTGKSTLAAALCDVLTGEGRDAVVVPEYLRVFCDAHGRPPRADEQAGIAREQSARIAEAASNHAIVIADTSALMTAVYSEQFFGDAGLYPSAHAAHRRCDLTLLTGQDLPWQADGIQRTGPESRVAVDARLRAALIRLQLPFSVLYGSVEMRVRAALAAIRRDRQPPVVAAATRWRWNCRHCGDAPCLDPLRWTQP